VVERTIRIEGARSHNLAGIDCTIPLGGLTVVTGVSGSGKSTLAFDTLYAEGQRRYVTSLSTYARQFLERLPRPEVDAISNLPPAIAIEQHNRVTNARSTVGTATEILDHLRLLYAKVGETVCPDCELPVEAATAQSVADRLLESFEGERLVVAAPLARRRGEKPGELRERLARDGFTRWIDEQGTVVDLTETSLREITRLRKSALQLIDRLVPRVADRARLAEAVAQAFARGEGELVAIDGDGRRSVHVEGFACGGCGRVFRVPEPALFSFNSPLGACEVCQGFGRTAEVDLERVIPDPARTLEDDAIAPFTTKMGREMYGDLLRACRGSGVPTDVAWQELSEDDRAFVLEGDDDVDWYGILGYFDWLERRRYRVQARVLIARYRRFDECHACHGARLREEALCVRVGGRSIADVSRSTIGELRAWADGLELAPREAARAERLLPLLRRRIATVDEVGLGYLGLDRQVRTLSGGEAQRIQLATALSGALTSTLYVLDEPSIGLHPSDVERLLAVLRRIRDHGNTVVLVEHATEIVRCADHVIDLGPGAGRHGGQLVVEGSVDAVRRHSVSRTGLALRGELEASERRSGERRASGRLRIVGARANNLAKLDVEIPLGQLVAVTGVSGAGKSTLVRSVLVGQLLREPERGACDGLEGAEHVRDVVVVDQTPAVRSPRSNPATVSKAFDAIRARFADTREARRLDVGPGWFSFNVEGGRCETCEGAGEVVIDMQFLDDVRVPCEACNGLRYRREVLDIRVDGRSIVDVLAMSVEEALGVFAAERKIASRLEPLARVGLGYVALGQPLSTLSGGENQRLRLALALGANRPGGLYVLDEPTTGLHPVDVQVLVRCLDQLLDTGSSVIVVEHNLDVIRQADHVIDLGPGGGPAGGRVVAQGTPAEVARQADVSRTGAALRDSGLH
jgi:excinuclease ABC subunit A